LSLHDAFRSHGTPFCGLSDVGGDALHAAARHAFCQRYRLLEALSRRTCSGLSSSVGEQLGEAWKQYIKRLAQEAGMENPSEEDARRLDRKRKKRVSNQDWESKTDPASRITKMKDGRTHLGYKAEHVIDLQSEVVVA